MSIRLNAAAGLLAALGAGLLPAAAAAQTKLLRFPDIDGDRVAFCYAGDLWTAPAKGGTATRLTAHPGLELFPKFSPDGKWIAFTGQYDGDEQVYVMPGRGRRAEAAHLLPGPRAASRRAAATTTRSWAGRPTAQRSSSARCATPTASARRASSTRCPRRAGLREALPMPDLGRGRLLARRQAHRLLAPLPRLPHLEALRGRLGAGPLRLRPRHERREALRHQQAHRARPDVDRRRDLLRLRPRRHAQPLLAATSKTDAVAQLTHEHDLGRALAVVRQRVAHRLRAERRAARLRRPGEGRPGDLDLRARRRRRDAPLARSASRRTSRTSSSARRASGRSSWPAATSSPLPDREGPDAQPDATSGAHDKHARWSPDGKRIAFVSDASAARTSSGSSTRRAGKPEPLTKGRQGMTLRAGVVGRRHAPRLLATRTASSSSSPSPTEGRSRSPTTSAARSATTPGRRRAPSSPSR